MTDLLSRSKSARGANIHSTIGPVTQPPEFPPTPQDPANEPPAVPPPYQAPSPYPPPPPAPEQSAQYPQYAPPPLYPQPSPWGDPASAYAPQAPKPGTNGFAIAALVFGIIPVCFIGVVFAIVALVQIGKTRQKGKGFAIAGLVLSGLWLIGIVTAGVIGSLDKADRDASGAVTKEGKILTDDLKVGDCFNGLEDFKVGTTIASVTGVPCAELHEAQAFGEVPLKGSKYPGTEVLQRQEQGQACIDKLEEVAPKTFKAQNVGVIWIYPQKLSWKLGNHHLTCVAISVGRSTGTVIE